jgi:hypothetical protein
MEHRQDTALGLLFASIGIAATWQASAYSGATGIYPMVLGLVLLVLGLLLAGRALRKLALDLAPKRRQLLLAPLNMAIATIVFSTYLALIVPLGFYTASVLLMLFLPAVLGFRQPLYLAVMAVVFIFVLLVVFTLVLEKPLPAEFWSSVRMGAQ